MNEINKDVNILADCIKLLNLRQKKILKRRAEILKRIDQIQKEITRSATRLKVIIEEPIEPPPSLAGSSSPKRTDR